MSDLVGNHIVGFPMRRLICHWELLLVSLASYMYLFFYLGGGVGEWDCKQCSIRCDAAECGIFSAALLLT